MVNSELLVKSLASASDVEEILSQEEEKPSVLSLSESVPEVEFNGEQDDVEKPCAVVRVTPENDVNGDGRADVVMVITSKTHPDKGSSGAWLIGDDQTASWGNLSTVSGNMQIFGFGITSAGKQTCDIYLYDPTTKVLGAWVTNDSGAVTGWKTISDFNDNTNVIALGDFNGDGQSDALLRSNAGDVGCFATGGEKAGWNYFQSLGREWEISAVGDFNGDGVDDVVLTHDAGFAGCWLLNDDMTVKWTDLDTLKSGTEVVGSGDFNGDGVDDVLLKTGNYYGAWLVEDGRAAGWMGLGDLGAGRVLEQIADFDGDGVDDLRVKADGKSVGALLVKGADTLEWNYYGSVGTEWSTALASI